jgi:putative hydroxymethylpyrimidine transport system permease protein
VRVGPGRRGAVSRRLHRAWPPAAVLAVLAGGWEFAARALGLPHYVLPAPSSIAQALVGRWTDTLKSATWVTLQEVALGFGLALGSGLALATLLHASPAARRGIYPLLIGSQTIPVVVIGPVLAIVFGYTIVPKLLLVALVCFFPIVVNALDGLSLTDPQLLALMRTLHGSPVASFRRVQFPAALPSIFSGIRVAASYAAIGAVFGEYAGSSDGLGYVLIQATPQLQTALAFAAITLLSVISVALFAAVSVTERVLIPWAVEGMDT